MKGGWDSVRCNGQDASPCPQAEPQDVGTVYAVRCETKSDFNIMSIIITDSIATQWQSVRFRNLRCMSDASNPKLRTRTAKGGLGERLGLAPVGTPITP